MPKRIAVVLSGCGVFDGSEVHEAVVTLLALDRAQAEIVCTAPNIPQAAVVNHVTGEPVPGATRNVLEEAARIARGTVFELATLDPNELDGAIFPGGYGAARNLCSWAEKQDACTVNPDVERLVRSMHAARKPLGFVCIAPVIAAKVLGEHHPKLTIGNDPDVAASLEKMGARHVPCEVADCVVDRDHKIVTTPAYMLAGRISEAASGIERLVAAVLELCSK